MGKVIFRTYPSEPVIFQLGTSDAVRALKAAEVVYNDIKGIDINMGCPYRFSVAGGMGAALLNTPDVVKDIVATLKRNLPSAHISCKVRILPSFKDSLEMLRNIEMAGADVTFFILFLFLRKNIVFF